MERVEWQSLLWEEAGAMKEAEHLASKSPAEDVNTVSHKTH